MKQTLLVAVASAAIGAATAVLLTDPPAPPARSPAPARLSTVDLEVAFVRALETAGLGRQPPSRSGAPSAPTAPGRATDEAATPIRVADGKESLPAANLPELEALEGFKKDEKLRRAWMFRPAREVVAWLGSPDRAWADRGGETWLYELPDGTQRALEFHRGRLLNIID